MAMGFPREQCIAALKAAYCNSDRAVDYIFNGIPPSGAAQGSQGGSHTLPELGQLRQMLQNDPGSLQNILNQLSQTDPDLYNVLEWLGSCCRRTRMSCRTF